MDIKKFLNEITGISAIVGAGYISIYAAILIAVIKLGSMWYGYVQRERAIEDIKEYYPNGNLKKTSKKFRP